jgi:hypothetical protein
MLRVNRPLCACGIILAAGLGSSFLLFTEPVAYLQDVVKLDKNYVLNSKNEYVAAPVVPRNAAQKVVATTLTVALADHTINNKKVRLRS